MTWKMWQDSERAIGPMGGRCAFGVSKSMCLPQNSAERQGSKGCIGGMLPPDVKAG